MLVPRPGTLDCRRRSEIMAQQLYQQPYIPLAPFPLTPQQRNVLRLRFDDGGRACRTRVEVAELLGRSAGRVRNIESKALHRLRVLQRVAWAGHPLPSDQMADWEQFQAGMH